MSTTGQLYKMVAQLVFFYYCLAAPSQHFSQDQTLSSLKSLSSTQIDIYENKSLTPHCLLISCAFTVVEENTEATIS